MQERKYEQGKPCNQANAQCSPNDALAFVTGIAQDNKEPVLWTATSQRKVFGQGRRTVAHHVTHLIHVCMLPIPRLRFRRAPASSALRFKHRLHFA
jgi:hypothetical protein